MLVLVLVRLPLLDPNKGSRHFVLTYTPSVIPISAVLISLDEAPRIAAAVESVRFCDEVLVVDAGSQDRTREVA